MTSKKKELTVSQKLEIIDFLKAKKYTRKQIKDIYNCDDSLISRVVRREEKLRQIPNPEQAIRSRIQKGRTYLVTEAITRWYRMMRAQNAFINGPMVLRQANKFARIMNLDFRASNGWLSRWQKKENVVFKKLKQQSTAAERLAAEQWKEMSLQDLFEGTNDGNKNLMMEIANASSMKLVEKTITPCENDEGEDHGHEIPVEVDIKIKDVTLPKGTLGNDMAASANAKPPEKQIAEHPISPGKKAQNAMGSENVNKYGLRSKEATSANNETLVSNQAEINVENRKERKSDIVLIPSKDEANKAFDIILQYLSSNDVNVSTLDDVGKHLSGETSRRSTTEVPLRQEDHDDSSIASCFMHSDNDSDIDMPEIIQQHNEGSVQKNRRIDENISQNYSLRDQYTVYGENVAYRIRNCRRDNYDICIAQHNIDNIIFELTMGCYSRSRMTSRVDRGINRTTSNTHNSSTPFTWIPKTSVPRTSSSRTSTSTTAIPVKTTIASESSELTNMKRHLNF